jgi:hypothetical protein
MRSPSWSKVPKSHSPCGSLSSVKTSNVSTFSLLADRRLRLGRKSAKCLESAQAGMRGPWPWGPGRSARQMRLVFCSLVVMVSFSLLFAGCACNPTARTIHAKPSLRS